MTVLHGWRCERDCFWNNRHWNKGQVYELTAAQAKDLPQHFVHVGRRKLSVKEVRLNEINKKMARLSARRNKLRMMRAGFNNAVVPELNAVEKEFAALDLEKYELQRKRDS